MPSFNIRDLFAPRFPAIVPGTILAATRSELAESSPVAADPISFKDVCEVYLDYLPTRARNLSAPDEIKFFRRYVMNAEVNSWTNKPMSEVTDEDVADFVNRFVKIGKPALGRNCLIKLRAMLSWAMAPDRRRVFGLNANPALHLTPRLLNLNARGTRKRILSRAELRAYLVACERLPDVADEVLGKALAYIPRRMIELTRAKWSDVDLEQRLWTVQSAQNDGSVHPLSNVATSLLEELRSIALPEPNDFVFSNGAGNTGPRNRSRMKRMIDDRMKQILRDDGIEFREWRWQDLRTTVYALLVDVCGPDDIAKIAVGRAVGIPRLYTYLTIRQNVRAALELLAVELTAIRNGMPGLNG